MSKVSIAAQNGELDTRVDRSLEFFLPVEKKGGLHRSVHL